MAEEAGCAIADLVSVALIDCDVPADVSAPVPIPPIAPSSPTEDAQIATIEQTGAGPPPD